MHRPVRAAARNSGYSNARRATRASVAAASGHNKENVPDSKKRARVSKQPKRQQSESSASSSSSKRARRRTPLSPLYTSSLPEDYFVQLPDSVLLNICSFLVHNDAEADEDILQLLRTCHRMYEACNSPHLWSKVPLSYSDGSLNKTVLRIINLKCEGTEGACYKAFSRQDHAYYAVKRARVYPDAEGVPYYMMRELAALKQLSHPNISPLNHINLHEFKLHLVFPYVEQTLHDFINPSGDCTTGQPIDPADATHLMFQLLDGLAYCHRRGIMHRNLKPKHLLILPGPDAERPLRGAQLRIADLSLVRILGNPPKNFTTEVITLWYRPPEILMGKKAYSASVDLWSVGCIFAEMLEGKPLFTGLCEIDQLFQIFSKMGVPDSSAWPEFTSLPNFQEHIFPTWTVNQLRGMIRHASDEQYDLILQCLRYNPAERITAAQTLLHPALEGAGVPMAEPFLVSDQFAHPGLIGLHSTSLPQYAYLRHLEQHGAHGAIRQMEHQSPRLLRAPRSAIIERLIDVMDIFDPHMCQRTVFFAVGLMDRFYHMNAVQIPQLPLLAATCLHIASKCEDVSYIGTKDLASWGENVFTPEDILRMEELVLNQLGFELYIPTIIDFVNLFTTTIPAFDPATVEYARFISELALQHDQFLQFLPSMVATAICSYALLAQERPLWPEELATLSGYAYSDIVGCMFMIRDCQRSLDPEFEVVVRRYAQPQRLHVSLRQIPIMIPA